jgi:hypothetical protein
MHFKMLAPIEAAQALRAVGADTDTTNESINAVLLQGKSGPVRIRAFGGAPLIIEVPTQFTTPAFRLSGTVAGISISQDFLDFDKAQAAADAFVSKVVDPENNCLLKIDPVDAPVQL